MAQAGYTPIQLYYSTTASAAPSSGNLANGELAINITDGKLYYKDNGGTVRVLAGTGGTGVVAGSNTQVQFNNNGVFGASSGLTWDGTNLTASQLRSSGLTSGRVTYASTSGLLVDSANMTFNGTTLTSGGFSTTGTTSTGVLSVTGNATLGDAAADTVTVNGTITSNLIFTDNTYDIGASGATRPRSLYLGTLANVTTAEGQILLTPTGYRVPSRATLLIKTLTNNPAEIDLLNTNGGLNYGWQISSRDGTTPSLDFYANNNNVFTSRLSLRATEAVFNEDGNDYDFRVESDTNTHALFVDAGNSRIGINQSAPAFNLDIAPGGVSTDTTPLVRVGDGSRSVYLQSGLGTASFYNSAIGLGGYVNSATFQVIAPAGRNTFGVGIAAAEYDGSLVFYAYNVGSTAAGSVSAPNVERLRIGSGTELVINEASNDYDFRVESNDNTHMLFVDAGTNRVNVGTSSAYASVFTTSATGSYSGGDVNAMFVNPSGRPTIRLRSEASDACEIFFDTGGGVAWDISCRSVGEGKPMLWFPAAATPSYASVGAQVMTLTQTGNLTITGALAKGSGSFLIEHPLPALAETHNLVHSFIEAPQADLYYRGKVALVNGKAVVNIDEAAGMTDGTFVLLNREVQCFTSNESDWDAVRGFVSGNILTIECQNPASTATVSWLVVGERQDKHMYDTDWTDENGKVIVEPIKPPPIEPPTFDR